MASATGGNGNGGGDGALAPPPALSDDDPPPIDDSVYRAVVALKHADELEGVIEGLARGCEERRKAAVNHPGKREDDDEGAGAGEADGYEAPLSAADRLWRRAFDAAPEEPDDEENWEYEKLDTPQRAAVRAQHGAVVGLLLRSGADPSVLYGGRASAVGLCILHGQPAALSHLLRPPGGGPGADPNARLPYFWHPPPEPDDHAIRRHFTKPLHACVMLGADPNRRGQAACLAVLLRDGMGTDANQRDSTGATAVHRLANWSLFPESEAALELLVSRGADVHAVNDHGLTPLLDCARHGNPGTLRALLARGASADVRVPGRFFYTPLAAALVRSERAVQAPGRREIVEELLRASSAETRRLPGPNGWSAADCLVLMPEGEDPWGGGLPEQVGPLGPWQVRVLLELLRSGVTLQPHLAARALPAVAAHGGAAAFRELAARRSPSRRWRAYDCIVPLAFDHYDARAAEEGVRQRERRVRELEEELRALGVGTEDTEDEEEGEEGQR